MSNVGTGFNQFKAAIEEVVEALGGESFRGGVACEFAGYLNYTVRKRLCDRYATTSSYAIDWTQATDLDFSDAVDLALARVFRIREELPVKAEAAWKGSRLVHRGSLVLLEGRGYSALFAMAGDRSEYDSRKREVVQKWNVHITDTAERFINGSSSSMVSGQSSVSGIRSAAAADKALLKLVSTHTGAKFEPVEATVDG